MRALLRGKTWRVYSAARRPYHCARLRETEGGLRRADLRVRLSRLRPSVRDPGALGRDARMPELPFDRTAEAAVGLRHAGRVGGGPVARSVRFLRTSGRPGRLRVRLTPSRVVGNRARSAARCARIV